MTKLSPQGGGGGLSSTHGLGVQGGWATFRIPAFFTCIYQTADLMLTGAGRVCGGQLPADGTGGGHP